MANVDWSSAPDGATHYDPEGFWMKQKSDQWFVWEVMEHDYYEWLECTFGMLYFDGCTPISDLIVRPEC